MARAIKSRAEMPTIELEQRQRTFEEVTLGLDPRTAMAEAQRCLECKAKPCVTGCPVGVPIPEFIKLIAQGDFAATEAKIKETNSLPAICGRVCPQESQCEARCVLKRMGQPIAIGMLERFAADHVRNAGLDRSAKGVVEKRQERVAVVGSGPAGLSCAAELAKEGYQVDIFEALHAAGGVLRYGIPEFRLPAEIVDQEIEYVESLGVRILTNMAVGLTVDLKEMLEDGQYQAAFIATGAGLPYFLDIPGENLNGVYSANEFLTRTNLMKAYLFPKYSTPINVGEKVAVIGAGNVAMDAARTAVRLGSKKVYIVYRRGRDEMPARAEEIEHAEEEGIEFALFSAPKRILGDKRGYVQALECTKVELIANGETDRPEPREIPASEFLLETDTIVVAVGQGPNPLLTRRLPGLELSKKGTILAYDDFGATSIPGIWAGGDVVTGAAVVITAMGAGKKAAEGIHNYLQEGRYKLGQQNQHDGRKTS